MSNNAAALVAWKYDSKLSNCLGFAVYRTDLNARLRAPLPAWVGFQGESNPNWEAKTTEVWPVQKFNWRDLTAKPDGFYQYQVVPMIGTPSNLKLVMDHSVTSNPVHLSADRGNISSYFNRGILATQSLFRKLPTAPSGRPNYRKLLDRIDQPSDPLRESLAGDMTGALSFLLERAKKEGGRCYCALYELSDPELLQLLIGSAFVHLILSNTGPDDNTNLAARQTLHESHVDVTDRMLGGGHIGHNKFVVYVDANNIPQAVLTGSTNWTATALCGQSNNSVIIESPELAAIYFDYWSRLKADGAVQSADLRKANNQSYHAAMDDGNTNVTIWFSPNTTQTSKPPGGNPPTPSDMGEVFDVMGKAKTGILFLAFQPGTPSIIETLADCQNRNPRLFVRGAVTDPKAAEQYEVKLIHRSATDTPDSYEPDTVVSATAIDDEFAFWHKELLKSSPTAHAIIHDKIVVVDPLSPECVVVTGSHNLGFKASYSNDENMLIIRGNRALAESYATHVLDVYDHYRWRFKLKKEGNNAWSGLEPDDSWQDKYFAPNSPALRETDFLTGA